MLVKQGSHRSPAMKFPDLFLTKSQFLLPFCSMKKYFYLCRNSQGSQRCKKNLLQRPCGKKICMICHFNVPNQLNHDIIYKMSNTMEIYFRIFLHFFLATVRLSNHIMTLTVKIWGLHNDINSILPDFSWLFGEFQNFLTHIKIYFKILIFSWIFPDLWEPCKRGPRQSVLHLF